jgi:hypothetical protein
MMSVRSALTVISLLVGSSVVATAPATAAAATLTPVVAYAKYRAPASGASDIYTAHLDGSSPVKRFLNASNPVVSPDGTKIAFTTGDTTLWAAASDGSGVTKLATVAYVYLNSFSWSPDDTRLVVDSPGHGLVIVNVATKAVTPIPNSSNESSPQWSVDGTLIASHSTAGQVLRRPDGSSKVVRPGVITGMWSPGGTEMMALDNSRVVETDVLSGVSHTAIVLPLNLDYVGLTWASASTDVVTAYIGTAFYGAPYAPTRWYKVETYAGDPETGSGDTGQLIADNALYPSVGGLTPDDVNGSPSAVSGLGAAVSPSFVHLSWNGPASTPDFAGVEIRYALGSTPPATVTDRLDGGRLITTSRDLGPLPPDQDVAISVFSRDWTGHVGPAATTVVTTPHTTASTLTAHASPPDITYGHASTITATLTRTYDGAPLADTAITIAARHTNTTDPFIDRTTIHTDATGKLTYLQIPGIGYDYQLRYTGDTDNAAATASTRIRVAHRVTETLDHASAPAGSYVHLTATVAPSYPNAKTYLQKYTTRAVTLGPHNTGATSKVTYTIKAPAKGTKMKYRVMVPSGGSYITGYGPWLTITGT